ncbi:MAG: hypothetical protein KGR26_00915, partial [Cyanobacteria bacterium REEB65]|nr:hypothetical protein [Cyanobacteria bacterium REEB65]
QMVANQQPQAIAAAAKVVDTVTTQAMQSGASTASTNIEDTLINQMATASVALAQKAASLTTSASASGNVDTLAAATNLLLTTIGSTQPASPSPTATQSPGASGSGSSGSSGSLAGLDALGDLVSTAVQSASTQVTLAAVQQQATTITQEDAASPIDTVPLAVLAAPSPTPAPTTAPGSKPQATPAPTPTPTIPPFIITGVALSPGSLTLNDLPASGSPAPEYVTSAKVHATLSFTGDNVPLPVDFSVSNPSLLTIAPDSDGFDAVVSTVATTSAGTVTLTARSEDDPTKAATIPVTITPYGGLTLGVQ